MRVRPQTPVVVPVMAPGVASGAEIVIDLEAVTTCPAQAPVPDTDAVMLYTFGALVEGVNTPVVVFNDNPAGVEE